MGGMKENAVSSGVRFFDDAFGGFQKRRLHLLVSSTGLGEHILYRSAVENITRLGVPALFVDCANTFSPYEIARISTGRGMEGREVLGKIHVSRPFTAYQLSTLFEDDGGVEEALEGKPAVLALLHPLKLVHSEDVPREDAEIILRRMLRRLRALRRKEKDMAIAMTHSGPRRRHLAQLMEAADYAYVLQTMGRNRIRVRLEKDPEMRLTEADFFLAHGAQTTIERFAEERI
jgi:hypothetical protein